MSNNRMRENKTARRACVDCKVNTFAIDEYYMVRPEAWWRAGMARDGGMLCIFCLENPRQEAAAN